MCKKIRKIWIPILLVFFVFMSVQPATADFFDKVDGFLNNVNNKLDSASGSVTTAANNAGAKVSPSFGDYNSDYGYGAPTGDPETGISMKALEAMAALGDRWARLKIEELRAKQMMEYEQKKYKDISFLNVFSKIGQYFDYRSSKGYYEDAQKRVYEHELANPNSGGLIEGLDSINESVLEFKALFGNKEAKAKLELLRAKREYNRVLAEYENAGFFAKFGLKGDLKYVKIRYEHAVENYYNVTNGGTAASASVKTTDPVVNTTVATSNQASAFAKERMNAAYKRYIHYLNQKNPDAQQLQLLKTEYEMTLNEYNRISR